MWALALLCAEVGPGVIMINRWKLVYRLLRESSITDCISVAMVATTTAPQFYSPNEMAKYCSSRSPENLWPHFVGDCGGNIRMIEAECEDNIDYMY